MTTTDRQFSPEYENPPIVEVACGIIFQPIQSLLTPHIGLLWEKFKSDYPICQEAPPLNPVIEVYENTSSKVGLAFSEIPPLPRVLFINTEGSGFIQVQRDRFIYNWRKISSSNEYPRYKRVFQLFQDYLSKFDEFLQETQLEPITALQYELTYVNHIVRGEGWNDFEEIEKVFPFLNLLDLHEELLDLEAMNWRLTFSLPDRIGRLHTKLQTGIRQQDNQPVLLLELVARGIGKEQSLEEMNEWFNLAHIAIAKTFNNLTSSNIQRETWRYKNV